MEECHWSWTWGGALLQAWIEKRVFHMEKDDRSGAVV